MAVAKPYDRRWPQIGETKVPSWLKLSQRGQRSQWISDTPSWRCCGRRAEPVLDATVGWDTPASQTRFALELESLSVDRLISGFGFESSAIDSSHDLFL